jgi:hypothetical protein
MIYQGDAWEYMAMIRASAPIIRGGGARLRLL